MKNKWLVMTTAAALMAFAATVQAIPVTGGISFAGAYTVNTGDINTGTAFTSFSAVQATGESGSFVGITPLNTVGSITMTPFSYSPFSAVLPLWKVTLNASDFFNLTSLTLVDHSVTDALTLKGTGTVNLVGFDPTVGTWTFTANQGGGTFSFSASNSTIPDGGTTLLLLGSALSGLGLIRRKLAA
jgi:hypothetical protein